MRCREVVQSVLARVQSDHVQSARSRCYLLRHATTASIASCFGATKQLHRLRNCSPWSGSLVSFVRLRCQHHQSGSRLKPIMQSDLMSRGLHCDSQSTASEMYFSKKSNTGCESPSEVRQDPSHLWHRHWKLSVAWQSSHSLLLSEQFTFPLLRL